MEPILDMENPDRKLALTKKTLPLSFESSDIEN